MDAVRVALLREVLAGTEWIEATRRFAGSLRTAVAPHGGGLLLVGSAGYEPWHLAAHLDDEAAWSGLPELSPTLVRHRVPAGAPAHLAVGPGRLAAAGRGATLLVVTPERPDAGLLERVHDARRNGATVLALDSGDRDLHALAHDALTTVPPPPEGTAPPPPGLTATADLDLDTVQHLVSAAAGENGRPAPRRHRRFRDRLARIAEGLATPPPPRW
ncbi:hypothetical protein ACFU90_30490 [Streptomyces noursei]|uniref:Uncharacterized protein n=1 Tax=Streptomyces noursei TaxID=1971 RepID=A0A059W666_STRNR|nr:hypothetical protein [Streptomyces noursei]AKA03634.1 hypothetical protein SAZ_15095 [Streptomyces noursei ZPM]AIA03246.1 hypothetical protein DC74_2746 [Streptomyces noursei]EOT03454.2 hypothetical protein K530_13626 [Streptomyces noursei CCRC 11814]EXU85784.1 hypothetical protein P354_06590 [Streptomyces noursei PD-1]UWS72017.1 hypothetical protein N1H47_12585 [Streptomyces noursei]